MMTRQHAHEGEPANRLSLFSDECDEDFEKALAVCLPLGIRTYELRSLYGKRVPFVDESSIVTVERAVRQHGITLLNMSPRLFSGKIGDANITNLFKTAIPATIKLAHRLNISRVNEFTFTREDAPDTPPSVLDILNRAAGIYQQHGIELSLENSSSCWANTGTQLAAIARATGLSLIWDPCNSQISGQPAWPDGYSAVRGLIRHVHIRDWSPEKGITLLGDGLIDFVSQLTALHQDGYSGYFNMESHLWNDRVVATQTNVPRLISLLQKTNRTTP